MTNESFRLLSESGSVWEEQEEEEEEEDEGQWAEFPMPALLVIGLEALPLRWKECFTPGGS